MLAICVEVERNQIGVFREVVYLWLLRVNATLRIGYNDKIKMY